jgi:hypothetical protein
MVSNKAWGYLFNLPITALAWKRLGFRTIAVLTVDYNNIHPTAYRLLRYVDKTLRRVNAVVIYFDVPSHMKVRLSQILRLVGGEFDVVNDDDYVMTSDADLWPLDPKRYNINAGKNIYITNARCCGMFMFNKKKYREYPLSNIAITGKLWKKIFNNIMVGKHHGNTYTYENIKPLIKKIEKFANSRDIYTHTRNTKFWSLDQRYASVLINDYLDNVGNSTVQFENYIRCERITVTKWKKQMQTTFKCLSDAHVFKAVPWTRWDDTRTLAVKVFDDDTVVFLEEYKRVFEMIYKNKIQQANN